ncbi:MAG: hypothetical protein HYS41_02205 [Candidatus Omnitrophica bacterium]|nr:hypothetical protein [Candidatus Omnitrophota bacterium]
MSKLIFVSCGQQTTLEKELAEAICSTVDATAGFKAFYADQVQSLDALTEKIFEALKICSGMISVLHPRGQVQWPAETPWGVRSSVWINQEIAILAFRQFSHRVKAPLLTFMAKVKLEGAMTGLITNPIPLGTKNETVAKVAEWLAAGGFPDAPYQVSEAIFRQGWESLRPESRIAIMALVEEGGVDVKEHRVRRAMEARHGLEKVGNIFLELRSDLINADLVKWKQDSYSGNEMSVNPTYRDQILEAVNKLREMH